MNDVGVRVSSSSVVCCCCFYCLFALTSVLFSFYLRNSSSHGRHHHSLLSFFKFHLLFSWDGVSFSWISLFLSFLVYFLDLMEYIQVKKVVQRFSKWDSGNVSLQCAYLLSWTLVQSALLILCV